MISRTGWTRGWKRQSLRSFRTKVKVFIAWFFLGTSSSSVDIDDGQGVGGTVGVQDHGWFVVVFSQMEFKGVAILQYKIQNSNKRHLAKKF